MKFARLAVCLLTATVTIPVFAEQPEFFPAPPTTVLGYANFSSEARLEEKFLRIPSARLAGQQLKTLTAEPHLASTPGDRRSAEYIAQKFRAAGLETEIVPYRVLLNLPIAEKVEAWDARGRLLMTGPTPEQIEGHPVDTRAVMPFSGSSGSGNVTGEAVYANYCSLSDFQHLEAQHIGVRGKIVLCRYGAAFRGVKVFLAEQRGAIGVLLYSDPADDGPDRGDVWPYGPWRPDKAVQRGSVQYLFRAPGDPETPGFASTTTLPDSARVRNITGPRGVQPSIVCIPLSAHDARPILEAFRGPAAPQNWQGAFPFRYRLTGSVRIHLFSRQEYKRRVIWDVIGRIKGSQAPDEWIIAGNHHDAWVYGAVDPGTGTAAMLETVRGIGTLLRQGWRPRRSILFCSWDAEEQGLIGSTEWVEQHAKLMEHAVAYFNMDIAVSGPDFAASATPSLKEFVRSATHSIPSAEGGSLYLRWRAEQGEASSEVHLGNLGSGSDFAPFFEHAGVPSADIGSDGPYGVYHSVYDSYAWYVANADPHFTYLQQMARLFGLLVLRMDGARALPYDYIGYAREISTALENAHRKAEESGLNGLNFVPAERASARLLTAARALRPLQIDPPANPAHLNHSLRAVESVFLSPAGLPGRPWYRHLLFAPGTLSGYSAVVLPGVNEAIDARNASLASNQLALLAQALDSAARILELAR